MSNEFLFRLSHDTEQERARSFNLRPDGPISKLLLGGEPHEKTSARERLKVLSMIQNYLIFL
jgi:hypothetical protein